MKQNPPEKNYLSPSACAAHYAKITGHSAADDGRLPLLLATYTWHVDRCRRDVLPALRRALNVGGPLKKRPTQGDALWWVRRDQLLPLFEQHFALHGHFEPQHLDDPKPLRGTHFDAQALLGSLERMLETRPHHGSAEVRAFLRATRARWKVLGRAKDPTPAELASLAGATGLEPIAKRSDARELWKQRSRAWRDEPLTDANLGLARVGEHYKTRKSESRKAQLSEAREAALRVINPSWLCLALFGRLCASVRRLETRGLGSSRPRS